jgi:acyl transferase domain-containing protein
VATTALLTNTPLGRLGDPEDVAGAVRFLCSDAAAFVTGDVLLVDQLTAPVRFTQAAGELMRGGVTTFVEIGPGSVLSGLVKRIDRGARTFSVNDLASLEKVKEALGTS